MVVDVERFGDPARTSLNQLAIREALYEALAEAFAGSGIGWDSCVSEDRGDGALILIPPEVTKTRLVLGLPGMLGGAVSPGRIVRGARADRVGLVFHRGCPARPGCRTRLVPSGPGDREGNRGH